MPMRTSVQSDSSSPVQSIQGSPSGLHRRSNSVTCPAATSEPSYRRLKRNRHGSGTSVSSPDSQPVPRKSRRNRSSAENSIHESPEISELISERSRKCFTDSSESDSNSRMEVLKTVVQEVVDTEDVSGTQTPQSNDEEGNNSENDDEQVAKLPHEPVYDSSPDSAPVAENNCGNDNTTNQRSLLNSSPNPSHLAVPRSISCDPSIPSTSSEPCSIFKNDPSMDVAFRQLPKTSLSSFSSVTSLIDSVMEPFSNTPSPVILQVQEKSAKTDSDEFCNSKTGDITSHRKCKRKSESITSSKPPKIAPPSMSSSGDEISDNGEVHVYPLRSRLRIEQQRKEWEDRLNQPRNLDTLPMELILRIVQYLSVQDLFALQCLGTRLRHACRYHLSGLRRINFSSGLPFAYLPDKLDDAALSHILRCTPEVTHILGFYPRIIYKASSPEVINSRHALTYEGILSAFQSCSKLRSVELMDVGLMSLLVRQMPTVKFHGMFRNRPDSWDSEYAVPLPPEIPSRPPVSLIQPSVSSNFNGPTQSVVRFVNQQASRSARLARWFEPVTESSINQGSPIPPVFPIILAPRIIPLQQALHEQGGSDENSLHNSMLTFAVAAANIHQESSQSRSEFSQSRRSRSSVGSSHRRQTLSEFAPVVSAAASAAAFVAHAEEKPPPYPPVSPFHLTRSMPISLPEAIVNLTKLDLVAVPVTILPRLDNVKYLHLKWVHFSGQDPFLHFQASKLQSFVMNNCVGPRRYIRFIRLFVFLTRAAQIMRLELVGTRLVEGLFEQLIDRQVVAPSPCFRNLQRLVMTGDRDITISDAGLILFCAQQSLTHLALQTFHSDNSLFEALNFARVRLSRLESLVIGYQDPYLSRLTPGEINDLDLCDSPDSTSPFCNISDRGLTLALSVCPRINSLTLRQAPYITRFPRSEEILASFPSPSSPTNNPGSNPSAPIPPTAPTSVPSHPSQQFYVNAISALTALGLQPSHSNVPAQPQLETAQHRQNQPSNAQQRSPSPIGSQLILRLATMRPGVPVKSLTLENCPGFAAIELENMIARGDPFGVLESLILRDMFPITRAMYSQTAVYNWSSRWLSNPNSTEVGPLFSFLDQENADYRKLGLLLTLSDLLASRLIAHPSLAQFGIGMGTSVRDVAHVPAFQGARVVDLPIQPFDIFFTLRTHTYLTSLLQMDGSVGNLLRIPRLLYGSIQTSPPETMDEDLDETCFASRATQTCICGLLEWDFFHRICAEGTGEWEISPSKRTSTESESTAFFNLLYQIGGPLAFHPHFMLPQHSNLFQKILCGSWGEMIVKFRAFEDLKNAKCFVKSFCGSAVCQGCSSDIPDAPSRTEAEHSLSPKPRVWTARDACVDTTDLRCHIGPNPCVLTLRQPFNYPFNCLTTLHLEKVGISHLVLSGVPRLKNITLENCPILTSILLASVTVPSNSSKMLEAAPSLKRVRIIRCPKFAIWNWLAVAASLYPQHDENLFITYRPFGAYNELVEQALWRKIQGAHVTVSHDYSIDRSERAMEETNSAFEQRFRELMHLTDLINIGSNPEDEINKDRKTKDATKLTRLFHTDRGDNWNLMTDASWMPKGALNPTIEVSLTTPVPPNDIIQGAFEQSEMQVNEIPLSNDEIRESEAQKRRLFSRFLNEYRGTYCFHRRGVHFHVQHRDIHAGIVDGDKDGQYLPWPYTDSYLKAMSPEDDFNVYGDGHDFVLREQLPPRLPSAMSGESAPSSIIMKREHSSEPGKDEEEEIEVDIKHPRLNVLEDCDNCPKEDRTQIGEAAS
ncbi:unnamed protein product [Rodentolepis nana]|uniref:F-box domain-containing protein n=1 Tax=Rodentolepis nana TaxID=102285 RepID=A0A0R3T2E7_RODNA|nr:unnamed protein product [Rodentolepis nana]